MGAIHGLLVFDRNAKGQIDALSEFDFTTGMTIGRDLTDDKTEFLAVFERQRRRTRFNIRSIQSEIV